MQRAFEKPDRVNHQVDLRVSDDLAGRLNKGQRRQHRTGRRDPSPMHRIPNRATVIGRHVDRLSIGSETVTTGVLSAGLPTT